jgi:hypothetical protein
MIHKANHVATGAGGGLYGLGFIGAVIYYLQHAATFWAGILGILKALVWPAFLVYHVFTFLKL